MVTWSVITVYVTALRKNISNQKIKRSERYYKIRSTKVEKSGVLAYRRPRPHSVHHRQTHQKILTLSPPHTQTAPPKKYSRARSVCSERVVYAVLRSQQKGGRGGRSVGKMPPSRGLKRSRASPATTIAKRIKPNPAISNVAADHTQWSGGSQQRVTWSSEGDVPQVIIFLTKRIDGVWQRVGAEWLSYGTNNTGSFVSTVPAGLMPGDYKVQVESKAEIEVKASSDVVKIDDEHRERCVRYALCLICTPVRLPYALVRKIAVAAAIVD